MAGNYGDQFQMQLGVDSLILLQNLFEIQRINSYMASSYQQTAMISEPESPPQQQQQIQPFTAFNPSIFDHPSIINDTLTPPCSPFLPFSESTSPSVCSLDAEISREEIEGDLEYILANNLQTWLKHLNNTTMNGMHTKKFGFREIVNMAVLRPQFPEYSILKRDRITSFGTSYDYENQTKRIKVEAASDLSASSSSESRLVIDENSNSFESVTERLEKAEENPEDTNTCKLRVDRLINHQKKKPKFNVDDLDVPYHSNMARNFPGSENRTADQQARRSKNTTAARMSRHKNKAYEEYLERESIAVVKNNFELKRKIACLRAYASSLMDLNGAPNIDFDLMWEGNIKNISE